MIITEQTIVVSADADSVFQFMTKLDNAFRWTPSLIEINMVTRRELGLGSQFETVSEFIGRRVSTWLEITGFDLGRRIEVRSIGGPFGIVTETIFEAVGEGTKITTRSRIQPHGGWKVLEPILPLILRQRAKRDYGLLRRSLENCFGTSGTMKVLTISGTIVHTEADASVLNLV